MAEATPIPTPEVPTEGIPARPPIQAPAWVKDLTPEQQAEFRAFVQALVARLSKGSPLDALAKFAQTQIAEGKEEAHNFEVRAIAHFDGVEAAFKYVFAELDAIKKNQVVLAAKASST